MEKSSEAKNCVNSTSIIRLDSAEELYKDSLDIYEAEAWKLKEFQRKSDLSSFAAWAVQQALSMIKAGITGPAFIKKKLSVCCIVQVADYARHQKDMPLDTSVDQDKVITAIRAVIENCKSPALDGIKYEFAQLDNKISVLFVIPTY